MKIYSKQTTHEYHISHHAPGRQLQLLPMLELHISDDSLSAYLIEELQFADVDFWERVARKQMALKLLLLDYAVKYKLHYGKRLPNQVEVIFKSRMNEPEYVNPLEEMEEIIELI